MKPRVVRKFLSRASHSRFLKPTKAESGQGRGGGEEGRRRRYGIERIYMGRSRGHDCNERP